MVTLHIQRDRVIINGINNGHPIHIAHNQVEELLEALLMYEPGKNLVRIDDKLYVSDFEPTALRVCNMQRFGGFNIRVDEIDKIIEAILEFLTQDQEPIQEEILF